MARVLKTLMQTIATEIYMTVKDGEDRNVTATNICICNTSAAAVTVSLSFFNPKIGQTFEVGAVLYDKSLAANETMYVGEREMFMDDTISAKASVADVVAISIDILKDNGNLPYSPP